MKGSKPIRLNRYLAMCGFGSRRNVESLVIAGEVTIDGKAVRDLSARIFDGNVVLVNGRRAIPEKNLYFLMNKPLGIVCAVRDKYYDTVTDILPDKYRNRHIFPVGRLDRMSSGLIILTNDGDLAHRIIHPGSGINKTYEVLLNRKMVFDDLMRWKRGIVVSEKYIKPVSVDIMKRNPSGRWVEIVLTEGIKREIRLMAAALGYSVRRLSRKKIGRMELVNLQEGCVTRVTKGEILDFIINGGKI